MIVRGCIRRTRHTCRQEGIPRDMSSVPHIFQRRAPAIFGDDSSSHNNAPTLPSLSTFVPLFIKLSVLTDSVLVAYDDRSTTPAALPLVPAAAPPRCADSRDIAEGRQSPHTSARTLAGTRAPRSTFFSRIFSIRGDRSSGGWAGGRVGGKEGRQTPSRRETRSVMSLPPSPPLSLPLSLGIFLYFFLR